jgi:hypothetical protein
MLNNEQLQIDDMIYFRYFKYKYTGIIVGISLRIYEIIATDGLTYEIPRSAVIGKVETELPIDKVNQNLE